MIRPGLPNDGAPRAVTVDVGGRNVQDAVDRDVILRIHSLNNSLSEIAWSNPKDKADPNDQQLLPTINR